MTTTENNKIIQIRNTENMNNIEIINKKNINDVYSNKTKNLKNHYVVINTNTINENCIDCVLLNINAYDYLKDEHKNEVISDLNKTLFYTHRFFILRKWYDLEEINDFLFYYNEFLKDEFKKDLLVTFKNVYDFIKNHQDDINYMK